MQFKPQLLSKSKYNKRLHKNPKLVLQWRNKFMLFEGGYLPAVYLLYREGRGGKNRSSKILCISSHTAPSILPWVFVTKILKPFLSKFSTKKNTKHYKAVSNYFFDFLFIYFFFWEAVTVQLILEAAGSGFIAACTQLGGLHPSVRNKRAGIKMKTAPYTL